MERYDWKLIMKRVLCLRFPNWPIQRLLVLGSAESHIPTALSCSPDDASRDILLASRADYQFLRQLFPSARSGAAIVAVNKLAWAQGVRPGMPLAEARCISKVHSVSADSTVRFHSWTAAEDRLALIDLAEEMRSFAPVIGLDELPLPDCLLLDITGCVPLFGSEAALAEQLTDRLRKMGFHPHATISESVATAWAFAHEDQHISATGNYQRRRHSAQELPTEWKLPVIIIPPGQSRKYLDGLPASAGRLSPSDIDLLEQLGISTLERILQLPLADLPTRLSDDAVTRIRQLLGDQDELIIPLPESDPVCARWTSEVSAQDQNAVYQVLKYLSETIAEQLRKRLTGATRLRCELHLDNDSVVLLNADFVRPIQMAKVMLDMLNLRMESVTVARPVVSASVQAVISPLPAARQKDLFNSTEHIRPQEDLTVLVNRLSNRLGNQSVLQAELTSDARPEFAVQLQPVSVEKSGDLPDLFSRLVTPEPSETSFIPQFHRPLRLLEHPVRLNEPGDILANCEFRFDGRVESIINVIGPERLQTAWWNQTPAHRDYYRIQTHRGSRYWLFRNLQSLNWYLHGIFD